MKNHTSLIISRYTQNTGKLLDQVIVIRKTPGLHRKTPGPLRKTPGLHRKIPGPLRKTPGLHRKIPCPLRKTPGNFSSLKKVALWFSVPSRRISVTRPFFYPLSLKKRNPSVSSVSCRTGSLQKGRFLDPWFFFIRFISVFCGWLGCLFVSVFICGGKKLIPESAPSTTQITAIPPDHYFAQIPGATERPKPAVWHHRAQSPLPHYLWSSHSHAAHARLP